MDRERMGGWRRRRVKSLDYLIQMRMLVALVVMEAVMLLAAVGYLHHRFDAILREGLYRVHQANRPDLFMIMMEEMGWVLLFLIVAHGVALILADRIWVGYVGSVMELFNGLSQRTMALDFQSDANVAAPHPVVELMLAWRRRERDRVYLIRAALRSLREERDYGDPRVREECVATLKWLRKELPPYSRRARVTPSPSRSSEY